MFKTFPLKPMNQIKANVAGMVLKNCVLQPRFPFKMADIAKNINFFICLLLLYYKSQ